MSDHLHVTRQNTEQARARRQESYDARAHTFPRFYEPITELPHWRNYVKLVRTVEVICAESVSEELENDYWFPSCDLSEFDGPE